MKKRFLTTVAIITFSFTQAQDVKFGTKFGLNISTLTKDIHQTKNKLGYHVGGFAEIKITDDFSIQPEILYSTQGTKAVQYYSNTSINTKMDLTQDLNYLNIPIMVKIYIFDKFYLETGPQIGFLLKAEQKAVATGTIYGQPIYQTETIDNKDQLNSKDFGVNLGIGVNLSESFGAGLRYSLGLSNIDNQSRNSEISNSNIAISILYNL